MMYVLALSLIIAIAAGAYCDGSPDPRAPENTKSILKNKMKLVKSVKHGDLYLANPDDEAHSFHVTHLYGSTAYENGYAHGQLLGDEIKNFYEETYKYLADQVIDILPKIPFPKWFLEKVIEGGFNWALDWTQKATEPFTDPEFYEEIKGIADASGTDYQLMVRIHQLPEVTKGHCSMFGAANSATASGELLQLRALDWDTDGPFKDHHNVVVYHTDTISWVNIAWAGFVGTVSGFNSEQMAISEIGVTFPDETFGKESRKGLPFDVLLRDILRQDASFDEAKKRIATANRTCNLILGFGDAKTRQFNSVQYSASVANFIDADNLLPKNDTWHAPLEDIVYFGMDWLCPDYSATLHDRLQANHGHLNPEVAIRDVVARTQTGNLHVIIYDLSAGSAYLSFAQKSTDTTSDGIFAFERSYTYLDVKALFATPKSQPLIAME